MSLHYDELEGVNMDQPEPASGEWTGEDVAVMLGPSLLHQRVAATHNAALAAEKLKVYEAVSHEKAAVVSEVIKLREQLAAERDRADKAAARTELAQIALADALAKVKQ